MSELNTSGPGQVLHFAFAFSCPLKIPRLPPQRLPPETGREPLISVGVAAQSGATLA